ncbi:tellurite resistance TerB family protein [Oricola indica]|uniref:tellurite resistance TerB family protein n=1 Tax=Oricola indica TaxID=2872591 RepID=UPI003CCBF43C
MNLNQVLDQFLGGHSAGNDAPAGPAAASKGIPGGLVGGLAAGGLVGLVAGNKKLRKSAGKVATGAAAVGGAAALGAIAYSAYQKWQGQSAATNDAHGSGNRHASALPPESFDPSGKEARNGKPFQFVLIEAMISAAHADGHVDQSEQKKIFDAVGKLPLDAADKAAIFEALQNPPDALTIASHANGIEQASEIYIVSRSAIDPDHPLERAHLERLSRALALPDRLVAEIEIEIAGATMMAA